MSTLSQFAPRIKSIQTGTISVTTGGGGAETTATATITAVDTSKSILYFMGNTSNKHTQTVDTTARVELTNSTTVTAGVWSYGVARTATVGYQVVEYY